MTWPALESVGAISVSDETAWCAAYASDSSALFVGSSDRNLYRVEAKPDAKPESIASGSDWITRIAVSETGEVAASEIGGRIHFASGGSVTTIGTESGVWALCFGEPGRLLIGTRKNGIVSAGQTWTIQPKAEHDDEGSAAKESSESEEESEEEESEDADQE